MRRRRAPVRGRGYHPGPLAPTSPPPPPGQDRPGAPPPSDAGPEPAAGPGHHPDDTAGPGPAPAPDAAPGPALARPRAATFLLAQVALLPVGLVAQSLQPGAALVWTQLFVFALPAAALAGRAGLSPARFLRLVSPGPRALGLALLVGAAGLVAGGALQALWASLLPASLLETFDVARIFRRPAWERALLVGAATLLAPACEEVAFRGHLLSALRLRLGPGAAIAASAAAFALLHLDPVRLPGLLFLGALYAWLTLRSGSLYPAVLAHAVNNAAATALALGAEAGDQPAPEAGAAVAALLLGSALLAPLLLAFHRLLPPAPAPGSALAPGTAAPGRWPRWAVVGAWAAAVSLLVIALAPGR